MFSPSNFIDRIKLSFRKDKELYAAFYQILGFYPHNISLYKQALQHKSFAQRGKDGMPQHNERLEFLGDAVLDAIVGDIVYRHFSGKREGFLTNTRSKIVQREALGRLAAEIGLERLIQSNSHTSTHNSYMGGNAFEALVGAVYLDRGYDACMFFMRDRILKQIVNIDKVAAKEVNFKSKLIEWSQKNRINLEFRLEEESRENRNSPVFISRVLLEGLECETGKGYSKKESHQQAARATLRSLKTDKTFLQSIFDAKAQRTAQEEQPTALVPEV